MTVRIGHLSLIDAVCTASPPNRATGAPPAAASPGDEPATADFIPGSPPADVLAEVGSALDRARELHAQNRELHFSKDEATGRVIVEVRDLEGNVLRTIPPAEALDVMSGSARL
jgi:hypothetical protein